MKLRTRITACALACAVAMTSMTVHADWIGDFYSSAGSAANITAPQAISSQSVVGFSGGGLAWRVPNKNFQPFQISPPSLKMGCGGIDAYLGSYSMVNKDEFVQALRNFGQAAVGYFFELALRTMAPEIAVTLDVINDLASRANALTMNNCAAAKAAVGSLVSGPFFDEMKEKAANRARALGDAVDNFTANEYFKTNFGETVEKNYRRSFGKDAGSVTRADQGKFEPVRVNVLRWAIDHADSTGSMSDDEKDIVMSLIGPSIIIKDAPTADAPGEKNFADDSKGPTLTFEDLLGINPTGVDFKIWTCSDAECLDVVEQSVSFLPFRNRIDAAVNKMKTNISSRTNDPLDAEHQTVLKLSSVPLYRAAAMSETTGVAASVANAMLPDLIDYAAVDAATRLVLYYVNSAEKALASIDTKVPKVAQDALGKMHARIAAIRTDMRDKTANFYANKGNPYEVINTLDKAERMMYSNLNTMLAANSRFGKR